MGNCHQHHGNGVVQGDAGKHGLIAIAGNGTAEVFNGASVGHDVDETPNHAVGTQGENQGGDTEVGHAHTVHKANHRTRYQAQQQHLGNAAALLGNQAGHAGGKTQHGTDGNVNLAGHDDEGNANCQQRIHGSRVEAGDNVIVGQKLRRSNAGDGEQQYQEDQAGHPPGFQQFFHLAHTVLFSCTMPKAALVRASWVISSRLNSPLIRP